MVLKQYAYKVSDRLWFENDVKMYGTQTGRTYRHTRYRFENDVKMYGTQTLIWGSKGDGAFENDVKMYGTQTCSGAE